MLFRFKETSGRNDYFDSKVSFEKAIDKIKYLITLEKKILKSF